MATPTPELDFTPDTIERAMKWSEVLDQPRGKARFQAGRAIMRDWLRERGAPNVAKNFLSPKMIASAGRGQKPKIPLELAKILGKQGTADFAQELQTAHYFLTGKVPGTTRNAFTNMLNAMQEAGMPPEQINVLKKIGPEKLIQMGGPGRAISGLAEAQRDPSLVRLFKWAGTKMGVKGLTRTPIPIPLEQAAAKFKPTEATIAGLRSAGVKGLSGAARAARGLGVLGAAGLAADVYFGAKQVGEQRAEKQRASEMALTGMIPEEMGGPPVVGMVDNKPITSGQFLQMLREREDNMKLSRFNAAVQESDLTRDVLSYISGSQDTQRAPSSRRIQLGSARPPAQTKQPNVQQVMEQFDQFLRQTTAG